MGKVSSGIYLPYPKTGTLDPSSDIVKSGNYYGVWADPPSSSVNDGLFMEGGGAYSGVAQSSSFSGTNFPAYSAPGYALVCAGTQQTGVFFNCQQPAFWGDKVSAYGTCGANGGGVQIALMVCYPGTGDSTIMTFLHSTSAGSAGTTDGQGTIKVSSTGQVIISGLKITGPGTSGNNGVIAGTIPANIGKVLWIDFEVQNDIQANCRLKYRYDGDTAWTLLGETTTQGYYGWFFRGFTYGCNIANSDYNCTTRLLCVEPYKFSASGDWAAHGTNMSIPALPASVSVISVGTSTDTNWQTRYAVNYLTGSDNATGLPSVTPDATSAPIKTQRRLEQLAMRRAFLPAPGGNPMLYPDGTAVPVGINAGILDDLDRAGLITYVGSTVTFESMAPGERLTGSNGFYGPIRLISSTTRLINFAKQITTTWVQDTANGRTNVWYTTDTEIGNVGGSAVLSGPLAWVRNPGLTTGQTLGFIQFDFKTIGTGGKYDGGATDSAVRDWLNTHAGCQYNTQDGTRLYISMPVSAPSTNPNTCATAGWTFYRAQSDGGDFDFRGWALRAPFSSIKNLQLFGTAWAYLVDGDHYRGFAAQTVTLGITANGPIRVTDSMTFGTGRHAISCATGNSLATSNTTERYSFRNVTGGGCFSAASTFQHFQYGGNVELDNQFCWRGCRGLGVIMTPGQPSFTASQSGSAEDFGVHMDGGSTADGYSYGEVSDCNFAADVGGGAVKNGIVRRVTSSVGSIAVGSVRAAGTMQHDMCQMAQLPTVVGGQKFSHSIFKTTIDTQSTGQPTLSGTVTFTFPTIDLTAGRGTSSNRGAWRRTATANLTLTDGVLLLSSTTGSTALALVDSLTTGDTVNSQRNLIQGSTSQPFMNYGGADKTLTQWRALSTAGSTFDPAATRAGAVTTSVGTEIVTDAKLDSNYMPMAGSYAIDSTTDIGPAFAYDGNLHWPRNDKGAQEASVYVNAKTYKKGGTGGSLSRTGQLPQI
jgi:hypothetical protein